MKNKSNKGILIAILLLAIGFAAVSTTLIINGTINFGSDADDFEENIIFSDAKLEYSDDAKTDLTGDAGKALIINDGKKISFTVDTLTRINETATLTYEISNNSQYNANIKTVTCTVKNAADEDVTDKVLTNKTGDYIKIEMSDVTGVINKGDKKSNNTMVITMIKSYVGGASNTTTSYTIGCTLNVDGESAAA